MRLIRASFAAMAVAAFASSSVCIPQKGDTFKRVAGQYDAMPVPNAPVVEPKSGKPKEEPVKPEEEKPKVIQPPEFAKPAKLVPKEEVGKKNYEFVRKFENSGFSVFKSNTGWILIKDEEGREYDKGKIISESGKNEPFKIVYISGKDMMYIDGRGWPILMPVDTGGSLTPRPNY